ncbi:hypothetical protein AUC61_02500 [Pseudomonas sp. S25]|uniref:Ig-like domain (Group 3) n=1 Tax=Pseudomonas maioricensis TaxID=1766623 RepID=A0ABS9ZCS1_9PSED|nr:hypothetical protein [Pseudomonas sp. S25]MCI8208395.1 hypothetical protein [Pseudomonas sp. S25]
MVNLNVSSVAKPGAGDARLPDPQLLTPTIDGQFTSKKVPVTLADSGLSVRFPRWVDLTAGHNIYLTVGGNTTANRVLPGYSVSLADAADPNKIFVLPLPASYTVAEGSIIVSYMDTTRTGVNPRWPTEAQTVIVDRTAPGGQVLPILLNPDATQIIRNLTESVFDTNGKFETLVADYDGIEVNDRIVPFIIPEGGAAPVFFVASEEIVDDDEVHTNKVRLFFDRADITAQGDGLHEFGYQVTDEAGNVSVLSPLARIQVLLLDVPSGLIAPVVPAFRDNAGVGDGVINYDDAMAGVEVEIPTYVTPKEGDSIVVNWGGQLSTPPYSLTAADIVNDPVTTIKLTAALVKLASSNPALPVFYTVTRSGSPYPSPTLPVNVDLGVPGEPDPERLLRPLTVLGADAQVDVITEDDYGKDARATIPGFTNAVPPLNSFLSGDEVTVIWDGVPILPPYQVQSVDVGRNLLLPIPANYITDKGAGLKPVTYSIRRELQPPYTPPQYGTGTAGITTVEVRSRDGLPNDGQPLTVPTYTTVNPDGIIDQDAAVNGAPVQCPIVYSSVSQGDDITLKFMGYDFDNPTQPITPSAFEVTTQITDIDEGRGYAVITIPRENLRRLCVGYGRVTYVITNDKGSTESLQAEAIVDLSDATNPTCTI